MIRFTIDCPDDLSAKIFRQQFIKETFHPNFLEELKISEKTIKEE